VLELGVGELEEVFVPILVVLQLVTHCLTGQVGEVVGGAEGVALVSLMTQVCSLHELRGIVENEDAAEQTDGHEEEAHQSLGEVKSHVLGEVVF
jgi:hypothetical protein